MNIGKTLFAQLMDFLRWTTFTRIVDRHGGDRYVKQLACAEQFRVMVRENALAASVSGPRPPL